MEDGRDSSVLDMNAIPLGEKLAELILRLSDRLDIEMERLHIDFDAEVCILLLLYIAIGLLIRVLLNVLIFIFFHPPGSSGNIPGI